MPSIKSVLDKLGFTKNESEVYHFLLKQGSATIREIYKALGIHRVTVYEILKRFIKRGFVSTSQKVGKKLYILENPERLKDIVSERKLELRKVQNKIHEIEQVFKEDFQQIKQEFEAKEKEMEVQFYKGTKEWNKVWRYYNEEKTQYGYAIFNKENVAKWYPYNKTRKELTLKIRKEGRSHPSIILYSGQKKLPRYIEKSSTVTFYFLSNEKRPIAAEIDVTDGVVMLIDNVGTEFKVVRILNKNIAQTLITLINMAAETAKKEALHINEAKSKPPRRIT